MAGLWIQLLVALVGGVIGATMALGACARHRRTAKPRPAEEPPAEGVPADDVTERPVPVRPGLDRWAHRMLLCQQAVDQAERSVDSLSSGPARSDLCSLVRRMDAELPSVRALVELGRGLDASARDDRAAATRVLRQLDDAVAHFAALAEQIVEVVGELVAAPDLGRVHHRVEVLRERFPLQGPLSALLTDPAPLVGAAG